MNQHRLPPQDIDDRVDDLVRSPLGCAFLLSMDYSGISPYEITSPLDAHELCARYPTRGNGRGRYLRLFPVKRIEPNSDTDERSFLTVDWEAAAKDWDGVHLTFGGLLTSDSVRVASSAG